MKKEIIGTGLNGLVGSRIIELLSGEYSFNNLSLETGINILDPAQLDKCFSTSSAEWVFHFAAKTDVDACEKDKPLYASGDAWKINVNGTKNIVDACLKYGKKMLYLSTDFVFKGEKGKFYDENDQPSPQNWYAVTKYEGEKIVSSSRLVSLICRISFPYKAVNTVKSDLLHLMLNKLTDNEQIKAVDNQHIVPTFIDDLSTAIKYLIQQKLTGIFHLVGSQRLSPYEMAHKIAVCFNLNNKLIVKADILDYYYNRAVRPFHAVLKNAKIKNLGINMKTFDQGLAIIKNQIYSSK